MKSMISTSQFNNILIKQENKQVDGCVLTPSLPVGFAPPKPPRRLRTFAANVRKPGFAREARDAIQKVMCTSKANLRALSPTPDGKARSQKSDTLGSNSSTQTKEELEDEKKSLPSSGSSGLSIFHFDNLSSSQSSGKLRKFTSNLGPPGSAKEAREAIQKVISNPNFTDKPAISSLFDYEKFLREKGIIGNDSQHEISLPPKNDIEDLVNQLGSVLEVTKAFVSASYDQIKLTELHIRLADSCKGFAAYRSLWFVALAELHSASGWHSEAAVAYGHSVAIIAKELAFKGILIDPDWSVLDWISSSIAIEEDLVDLNGYDSLFSVSHLGSRNTIHGSRNGLKDYDSATTQSENFTLNDLLVKIERCCRELVLAERFEAIGPLYRLVIPTLELLGNHQLLCTVYFDLNKAASHAYDAVMKGRRHLGTYFKVVFLGEKHFGKNLHQSEWIYHESGLTSLAEVSLSIYEYCRQLLGHSNIKIEPEKELDVSSLDQSFAYVQITHVEPLCEENEKLDFRTHTNCRYFVYENPILEDWDSASKIEPPLQKQAMIRTIIAVHGSFPSNRRRLPIDKENRKQHMLTPLEFASLKLRTKALQIQSILDSVLSGKQLDVKGLQLLLQGVLMPTVNVGPIAYAEAFSQPDQLTRYGHEGVENLCDAFRKLMRACEKGLQANARAIGSDQRRYHEMMVMNANTMIERLTGYFGEMFHGLEMKSGLPQSKTNSLENNGQCNS